MSNFIKKCLVVASGFCAIGLVLFLIGGIFGGLYQAKTIALKGGFSYPFNVDAAIFANSYPDLDINIDLDNDFATDTYTETNTDSDFNTDVNQRKDVNEFFESANDRGFYENDDISKGEDVEELSLELGACEFEIREWDGTTYKVAVQNIPGIKCFEQNGTLYIKSIRHRWRPAIEHSVTLYVPEGVRFEMVRLELGAGKGTIKDISTEEMLVQVGAGDLTCKDLTVDKLRVEIGAGQADIRNCSAQDARFEVGAGKLSYDGKIDGDLDVSCALGNIDLSIDGNYRDYDYKIEDALGNITIDQRGEGRITFSGLSDKRVDNDAGKKMDLECAMGNININFE